MAPPTDPSEFALPALAAALGSADLFDVLADMPPADRALLRMVAALPLGPGDVAALAGLFGLAPASVCIAVGRLRAPLLDAAPVSPTGPSDANVDDIVRTVAAALSIDPGPLRPVLLECCERLACRLSGSGAGSWTSQRSADLAVRRQRPTVRRERAVRVARHRS